MSKAIPPSAPKTVPNFFQTRGTPEESKQQRTAMQLAAKISKNHSFLQSHFKSTAYAIKGVAISFFNAIYYAGRSLVRFTICIIHCEGKKAFKQLGDDLVNSGKSALLVAISVFYVGGGLFFPQTVYCYFAPIDGTSAGKPEEPKSELQEKLQEIELRNKELMEQISDLQDAKRKAQAELDRLRSADKGPGPKEGEGKILTLQEQIAKTKEALSLLNQQRIDLLKKAVKDSKISSDQKQELDALKPLLASLEDERKALVAQLANAAGIDPDVLTTLLQDAQRAGLEQFSGDQKKLLEEIQALKESEEKYKKRIAELEAQLAKPGVIISCPGPNGIVLDKPTEPSGPNKPSQPSGPSQPNDKPTEQAN
jgi:hypothetical protein